MQLIPLSVNNICWEKHTKTVSTLTVALIVIWGVIMCPNLYQFCFMKKVMQLLELCSHKLFKYPLIQAPPPTHNISLQGISLWPRLEQSL